MFFTVQVADATYPSHPFRTVTVHADDLVVFMQDTLCEGSGVSSATVKLLSGVVVQGTSLTTN